jgi:hypothetical protein
MPVLVVVCLPLLQRARLCLGIEVQPADLASVA